jgi:gluconolactonase
VDDWGWVWTGESKGVVVRNAGRKAIGVFNTQ